MIESDLTSILLTLKLATTSTLVLIFLGTPLAFWLSQTQIKIKPVFESIVALPIVLPPTVLGFYLLWFLGPQGWAGRSLEGFGIGPLPFTFWGLVVGSFFYSLPFVVQPLQNAFEGLGREPFDIAATLRMSRWQAFFKVILPQSRSAFLTAVILGFMHTVGEFGVVLMLGGNIEGQTRVLSIAIYDYVEALEYENANRLALGLILVSLVSLFILHLVRRRNSGGSVWKR